MAVLDLERHVQFMTTIQPVCLPDPQLDEEKTSTFLVLNGWGNIVKGLEKEKSARVLQELRGLNETHLDECRRLVGHVASPTICVSGNLGPGLMGAKWTQVDLLQN